MQLEQTLVACRTCTVDTRTKAIERVIMSMRERLDYPFSLHEMAEIAVMSPFHFNRVFHNVAGIPPRLFMSALRLAKAKELLLTTSLNVVDVCFEVGYESLGTFTTRFTEFVGLSPTSFRQLASFVGQPAFESPVENELYRMRTNSVKTGLKGRVSVPAGFDGLIFVGLFLTSFPQARPVGCDLLRSSGEYHISHVPDGNYYVMAAALNKSDDLLASLLGSNALRGKAGPVHVQDGTVNGYADVILREARLTDPPIIIALPLLFKQRRVAVSYIAPKIPSWPVARVASAMSASS